MNQTAKTSEPAHSVDPKLAADFLADSRQYLLPSQAVTPKRATDLGRYLFPAAKRRINGKSSVF
jgi:hypothetical protein